MIPTGTIVEFYAENREIKTGEIKSYVGEGCYHIKVDKKILIINCIDIKDYEK